jgi:hypothetical protein
MKRREAILIARQEGKTFREIAAACGRDVAGVHRDYSRAMDRLAPIETAKSYRRLLLERLEALYLKARKETQHSDTSAEWSKRAGAELRVIDRMIKLLGLDKIPPPSLPAPPRAVTFEDIKGTLGPYLADLRAQNDRDSTHQSSSSASRCGDSND